MSLPRSVFAAVAFFVAFQGAPSDDAKPRVDLYGDPLPGGAIARLGTVRLRHGDSVSSLVFSPDGRAIVSSAYDQTVRLWDAATGKEIRRFDTRNMPMIQLALSADGKTLTGCYANQLIVWDVPSGKEIHAVAGPRDLIFTSISQDGKLASARRELGGKTRLSLWEIARGQEIQEIPTEASEVGRFRLSPDGKLLAFNSDDYTFLRFFDIATSEEIAKIKVQTEDRSLHLAFSGNSAVVAYADSNSHVLHLWDAKRRQHLRELRGHDRLVKGICFSPDGQSLASMDIRGNFRIWNIATGQVRKHWREPMVYGVCLSFSPDGRTLAVGTRFSAVRLWDVATGVEITPSPSPSGTTSRIHLCPDGVSAVTAYLNNIYVWDIRTGRLLRRIGKFDNQFVDPLDTCLSNDGNHFAAVVREEGPKNSVRVWDLLTGKQLFQTLASDKLLGGNIFVLDGKHLVISELDGTLRLWNWSSNKEVDQWRSHGRVVVNSALAASPDGRFLYSAEREDREPGVRIRDLKTGMQTHLPTADLVERFGGLSVNGRFLVTISEKFAQVWDLETNKEKRRIYRELWGEAALSPDLRMLAIQTGNGKEISLWELASNKKRRRLAGHAGVIHDVRFSADGRRLASASHDDTSLIWSVYGLDAPDPKSPVLLQELHSDLASDDAAKGFQGICQMIRAGDQVVPFLKKRLNPVVAKYAEKQMARFISELDANQFAVREKAGKELEMVVEQAEPQLRQALERKPSPEAKRRIDALLPRLLEPITSPQRLQTLRAIEVLEHIGTPEAKQVLQTLAKGAPGARETEDAKAALERLASASP